MSNFSALTPSSTLREAILAYTLTPFLTTRSNPRAIEPYLSLANGSAHTSLVSLKLSEVSRRTVSAWRDSLTDGGYSAGTVDGQLSKLRKLGTRLVDYELLSGNVFLEVGNARPTDKKRLTRALDALEIHEISVELSKTNPSYGNAFLFACQTAMRVAEVASARHEHLDFTGPSPRLYIPISSDKARRGRFVYLTPAALALVTSTAPGQPLVTSANENTLRGALQRAATRLQKSWFWHLARHTAVTNMAARCPDIASLMGYSGHSTLAGIQPYLHTNEAKIHASLSECLPARL